MTHFVAGSPPMEPSAVLDSVFRQKVRCWQQKQKLRKNCENGKRVFFTFDGDCDDVPSRDNIAGFGVRCEKYAALVSSFQLRAFNFAANGDSARFINLFARIVADNLNLFADNY